MHVTNTGFTSVPGNSVLSLLWNMSGRPQTLVCTDTDVSVQSLGITSATPFSLLRGSATAQMTCSPADPLAQSEACDIAGTCMSDLVYVMTGSITAWSSVPLTGQASKSA